MIVKRTALIIFVAIILVTGAYFIFSQPARAPEGSQDFNNNSGQSKDLSVWKKYENQNFGFEISFSPDYLFNEGANSRYNVGEFFIGSGQGIATVGLPEELYSGTNYFDAFLVVSVANEIMADSACRKIQREGDEQVSDLASSKIINGIMFYRGEMQGAAAGTFSQNVIYHAFANNICYEITLNLFQGNIGNYPEGTVEQIDENNIFGKLEAIFSTFKIIKRNPQNQLALEEFARSYLEAYKNIAEKNNFAEVKNFLTRDQLIFMQNENIPLETNYTQFDNYEILGIEDAINHYVAKVKLYNKGEILKKLDGSDIVEIDIIKEAGQYKAETWYFAQ